ncbi:uncharacterized protein LOC111692385 isoform X2 [Anoplophora glabripennis]|uniref:uncharacterized protein LOC111692385 isoform X2 n=1 Tax=Anoplophora glabripennis TaxID=217634 RepID=UPI000C7592B0|nr:uncharacterized protein LOC111692385 isoform X2 [Anoplophora glabripennis]
MSSNMNKKFVLIEFVMDGLTYVSTVPKIWLGGNDECKWPKDKGREKQAIIREMLPESDWYTLTKVKILGEYCTYKEAVYYEKKKENDYSSSSDVEKGKGKRKKKVNQKYLDRDTSVTPPPLLTGGSDSESPLEKSYDKNSSSDEANETIVPMAVNTKCIEHVVPVTAIVTNTESSTPNSLIEHAEVIFEDNYRQANDDKILNMLVNMQATLEILKATIFSIDEKLGAIAIAEEINNELLPKMPLNNIGEIQELENNLEIPECKKALARFSSI